MLLILYYGTCVWVTRKKKSEIEFFKWDFGLNLLGLIFRHVSIVLPKKQPENLDKEWISYKFWVKIYVHVYVINV